MDASQNGSIKKHTISLLVSNKPGVLIRISLVFARRGYNIDSLVVSPSQDPSFSMMNIVATGDSQTLDQILRQLNKLVDVLHARDRTGEDIIERELAIIKLCCTPQVRTDILQIAQAFSCDVVDLSDTCVTFQVSGKTEKLDAVNKVFEPYGIMEMVRTGKLLMARGEEATA
ncbi:MAG: acetolactate synthase small subunit [Spirochaetales bacterium]|jgi:acetolactate synthase-1/3 small subunit|nr:acetolactate synthase small subunit [Spirochaetales bacterium]